MKSRKLLGVTALFYTDKNIFASGIGSGGAGQQAGGRRPGRRAEAVCAGHGGWTDPEQGRTWLHPPI
jgi:hypothetical protein